jgi:hypothetical protein
VFLYGVGTRPEFTGLRRQQGDRVCHRGHGSIGQGPAQVGAHFGDDFRRHHPAGHACRRLRQTHLDGQPAGLRTRDTLSDLNKQNKVNASKYNFIKKVEATDTEVKCVANLALRDGGTLEYDYRIYKDGSAIKVQITDSRKQ